ncbi:carbohydrate diacid regulator [Evansella vedderi]|uniref:Carbohydrate diacid regulator n=1 Tax=Evansella vedderi TaxID=38282 RepID=A0ABT9ZSU6_9BACI|nr:sugar diacid recognition domain-containing protein [Evansella vedderi]MDQ0254309.1 carbohydrate diacid regulator [Evansella vedderi]
MKLLSTLATRIVKEVTHIVNEEIIVVDDSGIIMAASDEKRVGNFHEGAYKAVRKKEKLIISDQDVGRLKGVKAGLNLPIIFDHRAIGVIGITGKPEKVNHFGELIQRMTELIIQAAYTSERLASKYRGLETFVYEWVHLTQIDQDFLERGEILGISMFLPRVCAMYEVRAEELDAGDDRLIEKEVIEQIRLSFRDNPQDLVVRWGNGRFVLLKHFHEEDKSQLEHALYQCKQRIKREQGIDVFVGIGTTEKEPDKLHRSYHAARKALLVSKKKSTITFYNELTLDIALTEITEETRRIVVRKVLGEIANDNELLETLKAYIQHNCSIKETAKYLHIHINTLHYRLKRINELTGMPLKETENLVSFYLALSFLNELV